MTIKVRLKPETPYDYVIDILSAAIDNGCPDEALKILATDDDLPESDHLPESERTEQLKRIEAAKASRCSA